ncbi:hypothetical protein SEUCBS139899_005421 [Sporothrix eucalyptigena]|uniref:Pyrroloquinoline quinone-dependent pyranose dehydrogenase beta-propeller domain-containing protein n=1 Tax=Sporothrix eucalyptigena TaxID=1812306 RepID=A0ABP0CQK0_9PEZI
MPISAVISVSSSASLVPSTLPSVCPTILTPSYNAPVVAPGWTAQLIAQGLTTPRSLRFDDAGALLVVQQGKGIQRLTFDDYGGTCLVVKTSTSVVANTGLTHGIELLSETNTLYASTANDVFAWAYDDSTGTVSGSPQNIVTGMTNADHVSRTLLFSKDPGVGSAQLLVSRGSNANYDAATSDVSSGRSQIRHFDVSSNAASQFPYNFASSGSVVGWGLRNSAGLAEEPTTHALYSVENSLDDITREGTDVHANNPGEELNYHGPLSSVSSPQTRIGGNFGYPTCFALWDTTDFPDLGSLAVGDQFVTNPTSTLDDSYCASTYYPPRLTFQAHMAPLDILFEPDGSAAYVSFHGSWDRPTNIGYKVSQIAFSGGEPVEPSDSTTATQDIFYNADLSVCPGQCFRPVGLAMDTKGRLFVSSDTTGEIYVLQKTTTTGGGNPCRLQKKRRRAA